jgi:hypothetical protein
MELTSRIKKAGFRYRSYNPDEDPRMSATDAMRQVSSSSGVVTRLQEEETSGSDLHNIRAMFAIGLADGMGKPFLLMVPQNLITPLDVRDSAKLFRSKADIANKVAEFSPLVVAYLTEQEPPAVSQPTLLAALSIGDPTAENEMTTLSKYYLPTDQFRRAVRGEVNLVVGRKGAGKTALFIRTRDKVRGDTRNVVVDLQPEGYQLIKLKQDVFDYLIEGAMQHLITAFWEYIILLEIAHKLIEKDGDRYKYDHIIRPLYEELRDVFLRGDYKNEGDFSERLNFVSTSIIERYRELFDESSDGKLTSDDVTQLLHTHDIPALRDAISSYLEEKEAILVMFDNLDKGWSTGGVDVLDAIITRCLIDAGRKIEREMRRDGHKFTCIVFIRNDVYENVINYSADYGKEMRATLDWTDTDLLREMLRLRLVAGSPDDCSKLSFGDIWNQLCISHYLGEDTFQYMADRSLMRPRNLLKIFNHCRGFATNFGRSRIEEDDIRKGIEAYSKDVFSEAQRELRDIAPQTKDILYRFLDTPSSLAPDEVILRIMGSDVDEVSARNVVEYLIYFGVFGVLKDGIQLYIYNVNYDMKLIRARIEQWAGRFDYVINPALWPSLGTCEVGEAAEEMPTLFST